MSSFAIKIMMNGTLEAACTKVTEAIKPAGFGLLTRIDFDKKIKEKIDKSIQPCVILGACNPQLAYEAYRRSTDVALLIPCNIVLTEIEPGKIRVEAMRPVQMLQMLPNLKMEQEVEKTELELKKALEAIQG